MAKKFYKDDIQKQILNRINLDSGQTTPLGTNKNDECFTGMQDIANEVINSHHSGIFKDFDIKTYQQSGVLKNKKIVMPCDWDAIPELNGHPVTATRSEKGGRYIKLELEDMDTGEFVVVEKTHAEVEELLTEGFVDSTQPEIIKWTKCNFVLMFLSLLVDGEVESITFSGYNPLYDSVSLEYEFENSKTGKSDAKKKIKELEKENPELNYELINPHEENNFKYKILEAKGIGLDAFDVDYNKYDVVVTNPPFSIYDGLLKKWLSYDHLDVILLAPFLNRVNPNVGLPLWLGQNKELLPYQWGKTEEESYKKGIYLGYGRHLNMNFENPTYLVKSKTVGVDWITTFDFVQKQIDEKLRLRTGVDLNLYKDQFDFYEDILMKDGTHPIRVNNVRGLPDNYYGWFISAIGILDILSNEEFEWYGTNYKGFFNTEIGQNISPIKHLFSDNMMKIKGKQGFHGILARRKDSQLPSNKTREQLIEEYKQWYEDYLNGTVEVDFHE